MLHDKKKYTKCLPTLQRSIFVPFIELVWKHLRTCMEIRIMHPLVAMGLRLEATRECTHSITQNILTVFKWHVLICCT